MLGNTLLRTWQNTLSIDEREKKVFAMQYNPPHPDQSDPSRPDYQSSQWQQHPVHLPQQEIPHSQQMYYSQQQPIYLPSMQPPPPPKKHTLRNVGIVCVVLLVLVIIANMTSNDSTGSTSADFTPVSSPTSATQTNVSTNQSAQAQQPTTVPTQQPPRVQQPTAIPTHVPSQPKIGNQVVVGGTEDAFNAKLGDPISQGTYGGSPGLFYNPPDSQIGQFAVILVPGTRTIFGIVITAPTDQSWDASTAIAECVAYLPQDSTLNHHQDIKDSSGNVTGLYQSGYSAALANSLSPNFFIDASGDKVVKSGTFSTKYSYADSTSTSANECTIRLGEQSTMSSGA
jgi:hypothetical protein